MSRMLQHVCLFGDVSSIPSQMVDPPWTLPNRDLQYFSLAQKCQRSHSVPGSPQPPTAPFADMLMVCLLAALPERYLLRRLTHNGGEVDTRYPIPQIFEKLVLGCIDASDSESRRIFQHFSNSTVAPIGRKKVRALFFSRKKNTFGDEPTSMTHSTI